MAEHITEERLRKLAAETEAQASGAEDSHVATCQECVMRFIGILEEIYGRRRLSVFQECSGQQPDSVVLTDRSNNSSRPSA
jgi:hypothetical protein